MIRRPPRSTLFPSPPLSRSESPCPLAPARSQNARRTNRNEKKNPQANSSHSTGRMVGLTGQSLPACVRLIRIDVWWGDQQIVHKGRSPMSYDSFSPTFRDRKSTRLNSSHGYISYAVFCLKKKNEKMTLNADELAGSEADQGPIGARIDCPFQV